jgi:hypothetical protein
MLFGAMAQALDERPQLFHTPGWVKQKGQDPFGGPVHAMAGGLDTPPQQVAIAVMDVAEGAPCEGIAFDVVDAALFDFPLSTFPLCSGVRGRQGAMRKP